MSEFREEIYDHYMTPNGAVHTMRDPDNQVTSGNHHVLNATYHVIQSKLDNLYRADKEAEMLFVEACRDPSGVFNRAPGKLDEQAHDDLLAIGVSSALLNLDYAREIYEHGNKWRFPKFKGIPIPMKWYYDNTEETPDFNPKHWHFRFPGLVGVYKTAAGKRASIFDQIGYCIYLMSGAMNKDKTDTSGRILRWLSISVMKDKYWLCDLAIKYYQRSIEKMYPNGMIDVMAIYHGPDHPFSKYGVKF
jgi:hypothetical protein